MVVLNYGAGIIIPNTGALQDEAVI
ncbi:Putative uncharacterized protein [Lactococcus lactis subsp. lactis A12]|uniref:Uncharacterized protein n=1 Tax=Lactococcus lactis subsp. lactis A12 TaxID=1137134 RepID=S6EWF3_LACLL|nr:Putative uncharacterized protein [Lactococcus lactis subsp. lactis A12]SBW29660.1 Hypothetical protein LLA12_00485 [Lactococcus lactis subsp. lactis]